MSLTAADRGRLDAKERINNLSAEDFMRVVNVAKDLVRGCVAADPYLAAYFNTFLRISRERGHDYI